MVKNASNYTDPGVLDNKVVEWLARIRSWVKPRPYLQLQPDRCALVVVDMLHYFASPEGRAYLPASRPIVARISALIRAWRKLGHPVIFTRHCHEGKNDLGMMGKFFGDHIRCGELESHIIPALSPVDGEPVLRKNTYDAYHGTMLDDILRKGGFTQVLLTGVLTHMCVETTARTSFVRGYEVYVPADATASSAEQLHVNSLLSMADSVAMVTSTVEVLERCRKKQS